jgi:hypothetical protein
VTTPPTGGGTLALNSDGTIDTTNSTGIITANALYANANSLTGFGNKISGLNLGESADKVAGDASGTDPDTGVNTAIQFPGSGNQAPTAGNFGLYATQLNVSGLNVATFGLNLAGAITLPDLHISVTPQSDTSNAIGAC